MLIRKQARLAYMSFFSDLVTPAVAISPDEGKKKAFYLHLYNVKNFHMNNLCFLYSTTFSFFIMSF